MNITPLDIRKHEFTKVFRGYDPEEVNAFLDMVSMEFETSVRETALLKEKLSNLENQVKKYRDIESTLQETLLSAQRTREDTIKIAKKQADVIIREAEVKAAAIVEEGRNALAALRSTFAELKMYKDTYVSKIKALSNIQLELVEKTDFIEESKFDEIESLNKHDEQVKRSAGLIQETPQNFQDVEQTQNQNRNPGGQV